jgi:predicted  nucleic acid-binding Zn-ribbon protein
MSERDAYIKKLEAQLEQWDADIDKLQAKAKKAGTDAQLGFKKQLSELRAKRKEAMEKMDEMRQASEGAWHDMKSGMEQAWSRFHDAFNKALKR